MCSPPGVMAGADGSGTTRLLRVAMNRAIDWLRSKFRWTRADWILGGLGLIGLGIYGQAELGAAHDVCGSILGAFAQGNSCQQINLLWTLSIVSIVAGVVACALGVLRHQDRER